MKKQIVKWEKVDDATGYLLKIKKLSDGTFIEKDVGNEDHYILEFTETSDYEWSVLPYDDKRIGKDSESRIITVVREEPLETVELVSPEDGKIVELEEIPAIESPLPAILRSPPINYVINAQYHINLYLNWKFDELSQPIEGVKILIKRNGELIKNENFPNVDGVTRTSYSIQLEPDGSYLWQVIPYNNSGNATGCPWWSFSTEDAVVPGDELLPAIKPSPPTDYEMNAGSYPTWNLRWVIDALSSAPTGCYISIKKDGILLVDKEDTELTHRYAIPVVPSSAYEWQVIPYDAEGEAENCPWWRFNTTVQTQTKEPYATVVGTASKQTTFDVPVTVKLFRHINKFQLGMTYRTMAATGVDATPNPALGGTFNIEFQNNDRMAISYIYINWENTQSIELPDDAVLFTMHFENPIPQKEEFSQICFYNVILPDPNKYRCEWYNDNVLLDAKPGHYQNGWINTTIEDGEVPLPINPVNMQPSQYGGTIFRLEEEEETIKINWTHGNPPVADGWRLLVKEDGVVIHDKVEVSVSEFFLVVKPDLSYEYQIIPFNKYGECPDNVWYNFVTETRIWIDGPITTVGTVESSVNTTIVPVTVKNFNNVCGCDLKLTYDPEIVTFSHGTLGDGVGSWSFIANGTNPGIIKVSWLIVNPGPDGFIGQDIPDDGVFFNLHFNKISNGTSEISFSNELPYECGWYDGKILEFNDDPFEDFYNSGSITQLSTITTEPPNCVGIRSPLDNSIDIGTIIDEKLLVNFSWIPSNIATGYKLYLSETTEFTSGVDVGNVTSHSMELNYNTTYFWKIVPYNEIGDASNCESHLFKTVEDSIFVRSTTIQTPVNRNDTYNLNVTVKDFFSVGAISLALNYEQDVISYQGITLNPAIVNGASNDLGDQVRVAWFASNENDTVTLPDDAVLFTLHFDLLPTSKIETTFAWSSVLGECEYASYGGSEIYDTTFNDLVWTINV